MSDQALQTFHACRACPKWVTSPSCVHRNFVPKRRNQEEFEGGWGGVVRGRLYCEQIAVSTIKRNDETLWKRHGASHFFSRGPRARERGGVDVYTVSMEEVLQRISIDGENDRRGSENKRRVAWRHGSGNILYTRD